MSASYAKRVLRAADRLLNALAGGNDLCTISGRCGYLSATSRNPLWRVYAAVIDWAFAPIERAHCAEAMRWENNILALGLGRYQRGCDTARALLGLLIVIGCPVIRVIAWVFSLFDRNES